jgi:hypothetical protein
MTHVIPLDPSNQPIMLPSPDPPMISLSPTLLCCHPPTVWSLVTPPSSSFLHSPWSVAAGIKLGILDCTAAAGGSCNLRPLFYGNRTRDFIEIATQSVLSYRCNIRPDYRAQEYEFTKHKHDRDWQLRMIQWPRWYIDKNREGKVEEQ